MNFQTGEKLKLLSESFGQQAGADLIYLWSSNSSGFSVETCIVADDDYHSFMKRNDYTCITQAITDLEKMNNVDSLTIRLHCISPYAKQLTSEKRLEDEKRKLLEKIKKIDKKLSFFNI